MTAKPKILPDHTNDALKMMIKLTEKLMFAMDDESRAMLNKDSGAFSTAETNKLEIVESYEQAADEFHTRLDEFQRVGDKSLIIKIRNMHTELREVAGSNVTLLKIFAERENTET